MDIYSNVVKYTGCREINCSSKGYKGVSGMSLGVGPHPPCQTLLLVGFFLTLFHFSSLFKYTVSDEMYKWPTTSCCGSIVEKAEITCVCDKTPSDLLPKQASL